MIRPPLIISRPGIAGILPVTREGDDLLHFGIDAPEKIDATNHVATAMVLQVERPSLRVEIIFDAQHVTLQGEMECHAAVLRFRRADPNTFSNSRWKSYPPLIG